MRTKIKSFQKWWNNNFFYVTKKVIEDYFHFTINCFIILKILQGICLFYFIVVEDKRYLETCNPVFVYEFDFSLNIFSCQCLSWLARHLRHAYRHQTIHDNQQKLKILTWIYFRLVSENLPSFENNRRQSSFSWSQ